MKCLYWCLSVLGYIFAANSQVIIPGYDNARRMEHTQCLGQSESHVECPSTSWILVHEAYIGYTSNRNDRSRTWCANDRACTQNYDYHKHISTYYRKLSSITVPASRSITCGGQAQSVNYVYFEYSCIPGGWGLVSNVNLCSENDVNGTATHLHITSPHTNATSPRCKYDCYCTISSTGRASPITVQLLYYDLPMKPEGARSKSNIWVEDRETTRHLDYRSKIHGGGESTVINSDVKLRFARDYVRAPPDRIMKFWFFVSAADGQRLKYRCSAAPYLHLPMSALLWMIVMHCLVR